MLVRWVVSEILVFNMFLVSRNRFIIYARINVIVRLIEKNIDKIVIKVVLIDEITKIIFKLKVE